MKRSDLAPRVRTWEWGEITEEKKTWESAKDFWVFLAETWKPLKKEVLAVSVQCFCLLALGESLSPSRYRIPTQPPHPSFLESIIFLRESSLRVWLEVDVVVWELGVPCLGLLES